MSKYIGVKMIDATETICCNKEFFSKEEDAMKYRSDVFNKTGKVYDIEKGYKVVYPDGYVSFSPKETFEKAYFKIADNKGEMLKPEDIDNFIASDISVKVGKKTTNTTLTCLTGYEVHGQASCVKEENFDLSVGAKFSTPKAKDQIWSCLGFVLQWAKYGIKKD